MDNNWKQLVELLKGHKVWIQMHNCPDPDAIASAYGLKYLLKYHNVPAKICYNEELDALSSVRLVKSLNVKVYAAEELDIRPDDYVVLVDGQKAQKNMTDTKGEEVACIDHHPEKKGMTYQYSDIRKVGACATLIAEYIKESGIPVNKKVASILSYGIKMDTDSFNRGVTKEDLEMYEFLFEYADVDFINRLYNNNMELSDLRAYGAAIENIKVFENVGIAYINFNCEDALVAMVSDFVLKLDSITVAVVYAEQDGVLKFSVRSEDMFFDAGKLIKSALLGIGGGGGHAHMAGGRIPSKNREQDTQHEAYEIQRRILNSVERIREENAALGLSEQEDMSAIS